MTRSSPDIVDELQKASIEYPNPHDEVVAISVNLRDRIIAALQSSSAGTARQCPHDMGFDRENGPLGCRLIAQEMECVCEHMHFTNAAQALPQSDK